MGTERGMQKLREKIRQQQEKKQRRKEKNRKKNLQRRQKKKTFYQKPKSWSREAFEEAIGGHSKRSRKRKSRRRSEDDGLVEENFPPGDFTMADIAGLMAAESYDMLVLAFARIISTDENPKKCFKKFSLDYHPDKNPQDIQHYTEVFKCLAKAVEELLI